MTTALVAVVALLVGIVLGVTLTITAQVRAVQRYHAEQPIKSTEELLGEVTVDMGPGANPAVDRIKAEEKLGK